MHVASQLSASYFILPFVFQLVIQQLQMSLPSTFQILSTDPGHLPVTNGVVMDVGSSHVSVSTLIQLLHGVSIRDQLI